MLAKSLHSLEIDLTGDARKQIDDRHTTWIRLRSQGLGSLMGTLQQPEAQHVYYLHLGREAGLLHAPEQGGWLLQTDKQGGRVTL